MAFKNLTFTKDQLDFESLVFGYRYKAAKEQVIDAGEDKRISGFRVDWFIQNINRTYEQLPVNAQDGNQYMLPRGTKSVTH